MESNFRERDLETKSLWFNDFELDSITATVPAFHESIHHIVNQVIQYKLDQI